mmetsp:Transcript_51455/g.164755  ORF Transcript_51455/g.164755 Transcript_51455/m.164755 type:complete len:351 (+) Transcript_51455:785-1837(+)
MGGRWKPMHWWPPGDGDLRRDACGLQHLRVDGVGRVREDLRRRPAAQAPADPPLRGQGRPGLPCRAHADAGLRRRALQRQGLRAFRLVQLGDLLHELRGRPEEAHAHGAPQPQRRRPGLPRGPVAGRALPGEPGLPQAGLRVERVDRVEQLQLLLRRRPADQGPEHQEVPPGRRGALPAPRPRGGRPLQHACLQGPQVRRRRLVRVVRVVALLQELRRGRHLPHAEGRDVGVGVRSACVRQRPGDGVLQRRRELRGRRGLHLHRLGRLERLLRDLQRHQAPLPAHQPLRPGQRRLLRRRPQGDLPLQPHARRHASRGVRAGSGSALPPRRVVRVGRLQRDLRRRPEQPQP